MLWNDLCGLLVFTHYIHTYIHTNLYSAKIVERIISTYTLCENMTYDVSHTTALLSKQDDRATATVNMYRKFPEVWTCRFWATVTSKGQIPLRYPGRRQVRGWSQTCSELEFGLSSSSPAAS